MFLIQLQLFASRHNLRVFIKCRPRVILLSVRVKADLRAVRQWRTQEFCSGVGGSTNSVEDTGQRERDSGGGSPLVRGSGGSCNLVQEISFHIVKFY